MSELPERQAVALTIDGLLGQQFFYDKQSLAFFLCATILLFDTILTEFAVRGIVTITSVSSNSREEERCIES